MTQCEKIVEYMREHGSISQAEAQKFGCWRLASRINDLRRRGVKIKTIRIKGRKQNGEPMGYARYSLIEED